MSASLAATIRRFLVVLLAWAPPALAQQPAERSAGDEINVIRWREDYRFLRDRGNLSWFERLKFLPLNDAATSYVTLGGELRERVESYDHAFFGLSGGRSFTSFGTRLLVDADLHVGPRFRAFAEVGSFGETGRRPVSRPGDRGDVELQQGFFDVTTSGRASDRWRFRIGRQEFPLGSGRLVSIREVTNARLVFDAAKIEWSAPAGTVVAFVGRPIDPKTGVFESRPSGREAFWALDWTRTGAGSPNTEVFYLGRRLKTAVFSEGVGRELRHTTGGRIWGRAAPWDYSVQAAYQFGSLADASIRAWGVATETGYGWTSVPAHPRIALRADIASGDRTPHDGVLGTFEAPYPALNYFSEAAVFAPANAYDVHPYLELHPVRSVTTEVGVDFLWRLRNGDSVYRSGGGIVIPANVSDSRYLTGILQLESTWRLNSYLTFIGAFVRAPAGALVRTAGGKSMTFILGSADLRL